MDTAEALSGEKPLAEMDLTELKGAIRNLVDRNEQLEESMAQLSLAVDDIGWKPLGIDQSENEMPLDTLQKAAETCRALLTVNPLVKRGIAVRTSYIWGQGVTIGDPAANWYNRSVRRTFGSTVAQLEIERTAAADGNLFFLVDTVRNTVQRIPFHQICGVVCAPDDDETVLYYKRSYTESSQSLSARAQTPTPQQQRQVWYPSDQLEDPPAATIADVRVDRTKRIVHVAFNRQVGWTWGVPDVFAVVFWSKAYKEYLEDCSKLAKAYAQFAWKITSSSKGGQQRVASRLAQPPQRDPVTGEYRTVGAAAALGPNQDMSALQTVRPVDFGAGQPLAALIAAGLEVPLPALTSDPSAGNRATAETLDDPTVLAMLARQQLMEDAIMRILELLGVSGVTVEWPPLADEPMHRKIQAIDQAGRTGMLYPDEWRKLILKAVNLHDESDTEEEPPGTEELPEILRTQTQAPAQPEPPAYGDHELRDEGTQAHVEEE